MSSNNLHISIEDRRADGGAANEGENPKVSAAAHRRDEKSTSAILALGNPLAIYIYICVYMEAASVVLFFFFYR